MSVDSRLVKLGDEYRYVPTMTRRRSRCREHTRGSYEWHLLRNERGKIKVEILERPSLVCAPKGRTGLCLGVSRLNIDEKEPSDDSFSSDVP